MSEFDRRTLIKSIGVGGMAALAGCLDTFPDDETEQETESSDFGEHHGIPDYAGYIPDGGVAESDGVFFGFIDINRLDEVNDVVNGGAINAVLNEEDGDNDAMVSIAMAGGLGTLMSVWVGLFPYRFAENVLGEQDEVNGMDTVGISLIDGEVVVLHGEFDVESVVDMDERFEQVNEIGDFVVHQGGETSSENDIDMSNLAFAVSEDAIISFVETDEQGVSGIEAVETVVSAASGDIETIADTNESVDWALGTAGHGDMLLGGTGFEDMGELMSSESEDETTLPEEVLYDSELFVGSLDLFADEVHGKLSAQFINTVEGELYDEIEKWIGSTATHREIDVEDRRVHTAGVWE